MWMDYLKYNKINLIFQNLSFYIPLDYVRSQLFFCRHFRVFTAYLSDSSSKFFEKKLINWIISYHAFMPYCILRAQLYILLCFFQSITKAKPFECESEHQLSYYWVETWDIFYTLYMWDYTWTKNAVYDLPSIDFFVALSRRVGRILLFAVVLFPTNLAAPIRA